MRPSRTESEIEGANLFHSYRDGWKDGARRRPYLDEKFKNHPNRMMWAVYERGYLDGERANMNAMREAMKHYGYAPDILR